VTSEKQVLGKAVIQALKGQNVNEVNLLVDQMFTFV